MGFNNELLYVKGLSHKGDHKPAIILLACAVLVSAHRHFGYFEFTRNFWPDWHVSVYTSFLFLSAFILLGLIPLFIVRFGFRERLRQYGIALGDWKAGLILVLILFPIIAFALLLPGSYTDELRELYPFEKAARDSVYTFVRMELLRALLFYSAWEFFFRGFMLFGLRPIVGDWLSICIQTIPSCLWHIGLPTSELFSSIPAGILFGYIALRTGSILWPLILHILIGISLDVFVIIT